MKNLIKTFCFLLLFISNNFFANASTNKIIVKIDNNIITSYELKNKIRTALFLSNQNWKCIWTRKLYKSLFTLLGILCNSSILYYLSNNFEDYFFYKEKV